MIAATVLATCLASNLFSLGTAIIAPLPAVLGGAVLMACVGAVDDFRPVAAVPRIVLQAIAVAIVLYTLPDRLPIVPPLPFRLEWAPALAERPLVRQPR